MAKLLSVEPKGPLNVFLSYDDGTEGSIDLTKTIERNNYTQLKGEKEFSKVFYDKTTNELCWPCGVRMCCNALHKQLSLLLLMSRLKIDINND